MILRHSNVRTFSVTRATFFVHAGPDFLVWWRCKTLCELLRAKQSCHEWSLSHSSAVSFNPFTAKSSVTGYARISVCCIRKIVTQDRSPCCYSVLPSLSIIIYYAPEETSLWTSVRSDRGRFCNMSGNSDDECPPCPRVRANSYDVTIHEATSTTNVCSGMTSNSFRWTYAPQSFRPGSGNQESLSRNRRPVRRANTWGQWVESL